MKIDQDKLEITMADRCLNVKDLCEVADVSMTTLQRVRSGYEVKPGTAGRIARALNVSIDSIVAERKGG